MKIVFKCDKEELFDIIISEFKLAKKNDNWKLATLKVEKNKPYAIYTTCCNNKWVVEKTSDGVLFGYEGTRVGAIKLQPFPNLKWYKHEPPILQYTLEYQEYKVCDENDKELYSCKVPKKVKLFKLQLVKYKTSTPKKWKLKWYQQIERILDTKMAVVMHHSVPIKLVKYKNVYEQKVMEKMQKIEQSIIGDVNEQRS